VRELHNIASAPETIATGLPSAALDNVTRPKLMVRPKRIDREVRIWAGHVISSGAFSGEVIPKSRAEQGCLEMIRGEDAAGGWLENAGYGRLKYVALGTGDVIPRRLFLVVSVAKSRRSAHFAIIDHCKLVSRTSDRKAGRRRWPIALGGRARDAIKSGRYQGALR
jgi:hypothetical protein